jgi:type VI secretion system protein ImpH
MGSTDGQPDLDVAQEILRPDLPDRLREHAPDFSFFQAVRLLERLAGTKEPLGSFTPPATEPVRLGANPSMAFPRAEIESLESRQVGPPRMTVNFFGLTGPQAVLPDRYTEMVIERMYARDHTLRDFLDIFNHRFISLLYRAWEKYRFPVGYERSGQDRFTGYMLDLIGLGTRGLQDRQAIPDQALICFEGLLAQFPRSASGFEQVLSYYFDVAVEIQPFAGAWRPLDAGSRTKMEDGRSPSERLGIGMVLGDEVWDQETVVRVRLGPMPLAQYESFLRDGDAHAPLKSLCRFYCGEDLDVEVQLILKREEVPPAGLGVEGAPEPRLGWVSWMFTRPLDRDPDETILRLWE